MKKMISVVLALTTTATLVACSAKNPDTVEPDSTETPMAQVQNPVHYGTDEQVQADTGFLLRAPENAEDIQFASIDGNPKIAQLTFKLDGIGYTYRAAADNTAKDISGLYYTWSNELSAELAGNAAELQWVPEQQGHISWKNAEGNLFDLSMDSGASEDALLTAAELFVGEEQVDPTVFARAFSEQLSDFFENGRPGTTGYSLRYAAFVAKAADLFTESAPTEDAIVGCVEGFVEALPEDQIGGFAAQLSSAKTMFAELTGEYGADLLESCGYTPTNDSWDVGALEPLFEAMGSIISPEEIYSGIIEKYREAIENAADKETLMGEDLNYLIADVGEAPLESVGVTVTDLDQDGTAELIIGTITDDDFLSKMILDLYTLDETGAPKLLFRSRERDRLYSGGDRIFANVGSSSAFDSYDTILVLEEGALNPGEGSIAPEEYAQLDLTPLGQW